MLALDVDGTLLDSDGVLRPTTAAAVARAAQAGIRPVLCTGRRYRRALPVALELDLDAPLVCNSGAIIKQAATGETLWRADIDAPLVAALVGWFTDQGHAIVSFTDAANHEPDFLIEAFPSGCPYLDEYVSLNLPHAGVQPGWSRDLTPDRDARGGHFHLCAVGSRDRMSEIEAALHRAFPAGIRTFVQRSPRYRGTMCEVLEAGASKWAALLHLAELWGIDPSQICAIGDDWNDLPMIEGAGLGVAMAHAPPPIRARADHVALDHRHDGLARVVDDLLLA